MYSKVKAMRFYAVPLLSGCSLAAACGAGQHGPVVPAGTNLGFSVEGQTESSVCQSPATPESTCTVTMTARVELAELEGREWHLASLLSVVRDGRGDQDLRASPGKLTAEDIRRLAGTNILTAHGHLSIPLTLQFVVGQAPFYIDGPHELHVTIVAPLS
jgi:hypothetical protein